MKRVWERQRRPLGGEEDEADRLMMDQQFQCRSQCYSLGSHTRELEVYQSLNLISQSRKMISKFIDDDVLCCMHEPSIAGNKTIQLLKFHASAQRERIIGIVTSDYQSLASLIIIVCCHVSYSVRCTMYPDECIYDISLQAAVDVLLHRAERFLSSSESFIQP